MSDLKATPTAIGTLIQSNASPPFSQAFKAIAWPTVNAVYIAARYLLGDMRVSVHEVDLHVLREGGVGMRVPEKRAPLKAGPSYDEQCPRAGNLKKIPATGEAFKQNNSRLHFVT